MTTDPRFAVTEDRCEFHTTQPKGALSQSARSGAAVRYERCKNHARHTIIFADPSLSTPDRQRQVQCCGLHKRLHDTQGWLP